MIGKACWNNVLTAALVVACAVLSITLAQFRHQPQAIVLTGPAVGVSDVPYTLGDICIEERLANRSISRIQFNEDIKFDEAIQLLSKVARIKIEVNWKAIELVGIERSAQIFFSFSEALPQDNTIGSTLNYILESSPHINHELRFRQEGDRLIVSTELDMARDSTTVIYNVRNIISIMLQAQFPDAPAALPSNRSDVVEQLTRVLEDSVEHDSWRQSGGVVGSLHEMMGLLIVTQTPEAHSALSDFLDALRRSTHRRPAAENQMAVAEGEEPPMLERQHSEPVKLQPFVTEFSISTSTTIESALKQAAEAARCRIVVDWPSLKKHYFDRLQISSLKDSIERASIEDAARRILFGDEAYRDSQVRFVFDPVSNTLFITDEVKSAVNVVTELYNIRDLISAQLRSDPTSGPMEPGRMGIMFRPVITGTLDGDGPAPVRAGVILGSPTDNPRQKTVYRIIESTIQSVEPDSWRPAGGSTGIIHETMGILVVTHTPQAQREVASFLKSLRAISRTRAPTTNPKVSGGN